MGSNRYLMLLPASQASRPDNGGLQGSQGLLQNLLKLGEAFLASEIGEADLQDLQIKLTAARSRDDGTIRELQKKIEELSGMSVMVNRLKDELREEKERAKEEAEDMTQEMAELRYQLMERVDEERELRARTEEASLRRISELESQLNHAWREITNLRGAKQSVEVQSQSRLLEIQHLKVAFVEAKSNQENLVLQKLETENQLDELQSKVKTLEIHLAEANNLLLAAEEKAHGLEEDILELKNTHESMLLDGKQQKEWGTESEMVEEIHACDENANYLLLTVENQSSYVEHEVKVMQSLIADFKLELQLLAIEYHNAKDKLPLIEDADIVDVNENIDKMIDGHDSEGNNAHLLTNNNDKKLYPPWTLQEVVEIVDEVTEEMTKLLRILRKYSQSRKADFLCSLESRLQLWSNIPQKALPERIMKNGVLAEWGGLLVDLVAQSRRELHSMQQKIWDLEAEMDLTKCVRADLAAFSKEVMCTREELTKAESHFSSQLLQKEQVIADLEGKLEQSNKSLLHSQGKVKEMEESSALLHGLVRRLELEIERSKSMWALEQKTLDEHMHEQHDIIQKERLKATKEVDRLERVVEELRRRLAENEQELEELVEANNLNIDAVVAAKLRQLEQKLRNSQSFEEELQAERAELASQVVWLQAKLEEAERELEAQNEQHVEALIQYEEERRLLEFELEAGKQASHKKNSFAYPARKENDTALGSEAGINEGMRFHQDECKQLEKTVELLKQRILESEQMLASQQESVILQKEINRSLVKHSALLDSELLALQEKLLASEAQVREMESLIGSLQDELLLERMESMQVQDDADLETKRMNRREEEFVQLKVSFDETLSSLQRDILESQKKEEEAYFQVKKMGLELSIAKEEVVKSEIRLTKALRQKDEQLGAERSRLEAAMAARRQAEYNLYKRTEELRILESEKMELQRLVTHTKGIHDQLERERDDLKMAYTEMENRISRRGATSTT